MKIKKKVALSGLLLCCAITAKAQVCITPQVEQRARELVSQMTLEEKIGQLNLPVTGEITTGQAKSSDIAAKIKKGEVGGLFNLKGVEKAQTVYMLHMSFQLIYQGFHAIQFP